MPNLNTINDPCSPWTVADAARIEFNAGGDSRDLYAKMSETARKLLEADTKIVKLMVFHSQEDAIKSIRNVPMPTTSIFRKGVLEWTGPEIMIDPLICTEPGTLLAITDPLFVASVKMLHQRHQTQPEPAASEGE